MGEFVTKTVTFDISEDNDLSTSADILGYQVVGIIVPTGWTAANVTLYVDPGDGTYRLVTNLLLTSPTANEITLLNTGIIAGAVAYYVPIIIGANIKLACSTAQLSADKVVTLLLQSLP
jgi:hypothetical protein